MRTVVFALSVALGIFPALADEIPVPNGVPEAPSPDALEHWRRSTIALGEIVDNKFITIGSGLLVSIDGRHGCVLTAKHVFFEPDKGWTPTTIRMRIAKESVSNEEDEGVKIQLNDSDKTYWNSPSDGADLAIIDAPDLSQYWDLNVVALTAFGDDQDIYQGASILTLGYPMIAGPDYLISPIGRGGMIAWVDPIDGTNKLFLIDSNIVHGNSGGPVFHIRSGITRAGGIRIGTGMAFIGIVSKNATEEAPVHVGLDPALRINPTTGAVEQYSARVENIGGIGIIEPVSKAKNLVSRYCPSVASTPSTGG